MNDDWMNSMGQKASTGKPEEWNNFDTEPPVKLSDAVRAPSHYCKGDVECIEAIKASMSPAAYKGYLKGNCMKYLWRYEEKGGVESLRKAQVYLNWLITEAEA